MAGDDSLFRRWIELWRPFYHNITTSYEPWRSAYVPGLSEVEVWAFSRRELIYRKLTEDGWWTMCFPLVALYLGIVFGGQALMRNRKPYDLRTALIAWNTGLAAFSGLIVLRGSWEFLDLFSGGLSHGLYRSVCTLRLNSSSIGIWGLFFTLSKAVEFGDTAFIVLRKRPLIFLHYFHHVATFMYCFYGMVDWHSATRWFVLMNAFVHTLMYGYFARKAARYQVPVSVSMGITALQVAQMAVGTYVNYSALSYLNQGLYCEATRRVVFVCLAMYALYVIMFGQYFVRSYFSASSKRRLARARMNAAGDAGWVPEQLFNGGTHRGRVHVNGGHPGGDGNMNGTQRLADGRMSGGQQTSYREINDRQRLNDVQKNGGQLRSNGQMNCRQLLLDGQMNGGQLRGNGQMNGRQVLLDRQMNGGQQMIGCTKFDINGNAIPTPTGKKHVD